MRETITLKTSRERKDNYAAYSVREAEGEENSGNGWIYVENISNDREEQEQYYNDIKKTLEGKTVYDIGETIDVSIEIMDMVSVKDTNRYKSIKSEIEYKILRNSIIRLIKRDFVEGTENEKEYRFYKKDTKRDMEFLKIELKLICEELKEKGWKTSLNKREDYYTGAENYELRVTADKYVEIDGETLYRGKNDTNNFLY